MLDEYKSSTFSPFQVKMVSKLIRAAYNNEAGERGTSSQKINTYFYRAPIILAGEQTVTEPAARDRIIEVQMSKAASGPKLAKFKELQQAPIEKLGKLLLLESLKISDEDIKDLLETCHEQVPDYYMDRQRLNQSIIIMGLELLARVLEPYGEAPKVKQVIHEYVTRTSPELKEEFALAQKTDIDKILEAIALMSDTDERYAVASGYEFDIVDDTLLLNLRLVYTKFIKFASEYNIETDAMNYTSASKLLKKENYFIKDNVIHKLKHGPKLCVSLHIPKLRARNLNLQGILDHEGDISLRAEDLAFSIKD